MTFYIPPFWCGVIATVVFEICMVIGAAVISTHGKDKEKGEKDVKEEYDGLVDTYNDRGKWDSGESGRD